MYKSQKLGIALVVKDDEGNEIEIGRDGKVGDLPVGKSVTMTVVVEADDVQIIHVDGKKNIIVRKSSSDYARVFSTSIHVHKSANKTSFTRYPENLVRLIKLGINGDIRHWEIALNVQNGVFWVTVQETYAIPCARDEDGKFLCPRFAHEGDVGNWPQMVETLDKLLESDELPDHVAIMSLEPGLMIEGELADHQGVVRWWNCATQMGAIVTNKGDVRVHWSQIIVSNGNLRTLAMNQRVRIESLRDIVVREGQRPTGFKQEAIGVR